MSPTAGDIFSRAIRCNYGETFDRSRNRCVRRSDWYFWGRWVVTGLIIIFILALLVLFCLRSRRARRRGTQPMYGTGWMAPQGKFGAVPPQQQGGQAWGAPAGGYGMQNQAPPPPPPYGQEHYGPPPAGYGASPYAGYGAPDGGIQQPAGTYQPVYSPPAGPPPGK